MASVDGKTSIKIDELINDTIVDGEVVGGHLILRNRGGAEIDAGVVTVDVPEIPDPITPLDVMPVGYIYVSVVSTSPATLFGGGTWVRIGEGRVLVGQDPAQTEFDTAEEVGGSKTTTMTLGQMPMHTHNVDHNHEAIVSELDGNHTHTLVRKAGTGTATGVARGNSTASAEGTTDAITGHTHAVNIPPFSGNSGSRGNDGSQTNLQPYLVVYMWKRTA